MKVVLAQELKNLGNYGEIKEVKPGYFRNYLFPQNLAVLPQSPQGKEILKQVGLKEKQLNRQREELLSQAEELEGKTFHLDAKSSDGKKIYGSVGEKEIIQLISKQVPVLKDSQVETKPIRELGEHEVILDLGQGVKAKIKVEVAALKSSKKSPK